MKKTASSKNKPIILFDLDYTLFNTDRFRESNLQDYSLYPEVEAVLEGLVPRAILGVFSEGDTEFQKLKIKKTGLEKYFSPDHIYISAAKTGILTETLEKYRDQIFYLVDDKLSILHLAKITSPDITTVWIKRGKYALNQEPISGFEPDVTMPDLGELKKLAV